MNHEPSPSAEAQIDFPEPAQKGMMQVQKYGAQK
jgi:hypothetical protein